jgi:sulfur carrier protein
MIEVMVNGAAQRFDAPLDVAKLLERLSMAGRKVAVERNGEIVPKSAHAHTLIGDGDQLEIVVAVGGG